MTEQLELCLVLNLGVIDSDLSSVLRLFSKEPIFLFFTFWFCICNSGGGSPSLDDGFSWLPASYDIWEHT